MGKWIDDESVGLDGAFSEGCDRFEQFIEMRDKIQEQRTPPSFVERHGALAPLGSLGEFACGLLVGVGLAGVLMSAIDRGWVGIAAGFVVSATAGSAFLRHRRVVALGWFAGLCLAAVGIAVATANLLVG